MPRFLFQPDPIGGYEFYSIPIDIHIGVIKMPTDNVDEYLIKQITAFNESNTANAIQFGYTDRLGDLDEMTITSDNKYLLHIKYDQQNKLIATFSNEEHHIQVQEIMFEKYWNEVKSLSCQ